MRLSAITILCLFVLSFANPATAQETRIEAAIDALFAPWDKPDSPGAAVAVIRDGTILFSKGYGRASLEYHAPIGADTVFHIASVSKQFTAFALVLLAADGKLSLDDDIRTYLPEMHDFGTTITIRHLLNHTSGLRDQWESLCVAGWRMDDVISRDHILRFAFRQRELNFKPGERWLYCNTGYTLAAEIAARVGGKPFPEWTAERIFAPLGMKSTHFHDDHERIVPGRAYSYQRENDGVWRNAVLSYANAGATSLFTTVGDLCLWMDNFRTHKLGGEAAWAELTVRGKLNTGRDLDYALGVSHGVRRGLKTVGHSGGDAGFRSQLTWFPDLRFGVVVLANAGDLPTGNLAGKIADLYLADLMEPVAEKKAEAVGLTLSREVLERYVGHYRLKEGRILQFTIKDGSLQVGDPAVGTAPLVPKEETKFFFPDAAMNFEFTPGAGKEMKLQISSEAGVDQHGERLAVLPPSLEELERLCGRYYSDELETAYEIVVLNGVLIARHFRHGDIPLAHRDGDEFAGDRWFFSRIVFDRDAAGQVTGFRLSGGRVLNLRFVKREGI